MVGEPYAKAVAILHAEGVKATFGGSVGSDVPQAQCIVASEKVLTGHVQLELDCTAKAQPQPATSAGGDLVDGRHFRSVGHPGRAAHPRCARRRHRHSDPGGLNCAATPARLFPNVSGRCHAAATPFCQGDRSRPGSDSARKVEFDASESPLHWIPGHPVASHMVSLLNVVLPAAERWFVSTYNEALPLVKDERLADDMRGFIGQEAVHAHTHEKMLHQFMEARGVDPQPILKQVDFIISKVLAPSTRRTRNAGTTSFANASG